MTVGTGATPPARTVSNYVVFVDESGDHSLEFINPEYPVFVLAFCIIPVGEYVERITPAVRRLKFELFGHDMAILHEHEIRKRLGMFSQLGKTERELVLTRLTDIIE